MKAKQIDMSKVTYSDPKLNKYGGKQVWVNHDKRKFVVQTPKMSCLFGLNVYSHDNGDDDLSVNMSFRGKDTNKSIEHMFTNFSNLDDKLKADGIKNSLPWFKKKKMTEDLVEDRFSPIIKYPKDKETGEVITKWAPTMKVKIPWRNGETTTEFYDSRTQQEIKITSIDQLQSLIHKNCQLKMLIQCSGIWFASGKYGVSWRAVQIIVYPTQRIQGFSFVEDSDDEPDEDLMVNDIDDDISNSLNNDNNDDDEEDDMLNMDNQVSSSETEEESDEEPVEVKKKKVRRKKKN